MCTRPLFSGLFHELRLLLIWYDYSGDRRKKSIMSKTNQKKTLLALVVSVAFIGVTIIACSPTGSVSSAVEAPGEVQRVTLEESKAAFDNGEATFVDVRTASSYAAGHIPGALSIPLAELQPRIDELDPNQWIITYCT